MDGPAEAVERPLTGTAPTGGPLLTARMPAGRLPTDDASEGYPRTSLGKADKAGGEL
jgi:hypothetical protein